MQIKQILRYQLVYVLLVILLVAAVIFNINTGNINISPIRIFRIIFLKDYVGTPEYNIIWKIRLPRLCMAAILGGALSLSGFYYRHFQKSYSSVCAWYFVRCQNVCCHYNDFHTEICVRNAIMGSDCSSIYRFTLQCCMYFCQ